VVGILSMKALAADGVSFCIPIDTAKEVVEELGRHGRVRRPRIGAAIAEVSPARMSQLRASCPDFPSSVDCGLVVTGVQGGSPADVAGLREDDVIVDWQQQQQQQQGGGGGGVNGNGSGREQPDQQLQQQHTQPPPRQPASCDQIAGFAAALKRHLDGAPLRIRVVRQAAAGGGYEFVELSIRPEEASDSA